jgi:antitoxin FitA
MESAMAQVIVRNLDEEVVQCLKRRARRRGHSLESELREVLAAAARQDLEDFRTRAADMRARYQEIAQTDSASLLRADRDR